MPGTLSKGQEGADVRRPRERKTEESIDRYLENFLRWKESDKYTQMHQEVT